MPTIHTDESTHSDLKSYCTKNGITQGDFVKFALSYFKRSGIDPSSPPESVRDELAKMSKRISQLIAFQKTFEQQQLLPLIETMYKLEAEIREQQGGGELGETLQRMSQQLALINPTAGATPKPTSGSKEKERALERSNYELLNEWKEAVKRIRYILTKIKEQKAGIMGKTQLIAELETEEINRLWEEVKAAEIRQRQY